MQLSVELSVKQSSNLCIFTSTFGLQVANLSEKDIVEMIFFPVVNEACRVLAEGIAVKASDLDIAGVMGMGFPPYRYCFFRFFFICTHVIWDVFRRWKLIAFI